MTPIYPERHLLLSGLLLFFAGLLIGFASAAFPASHPWLAAHLNGVQSGSFLIALSAACRVLDRPSRVTSISLYGISLGCWLLQTGITLRAMTGVGLRTPVAQVSTTAMAVGGIGLVVCVATVALTAPWGRRA